MNLKLVLSLLVVAILSGCTHSIHMVHTDGFGLDMSSQKKRTKIIEAKSEQDVFLFFAFDTNYVDKAKNDLVSKCNGDLQAVSTQYSTSHGFLHWTNKILMKGICASQLLSLSQKNPAQCGIFFDLIKPVLLRGQLGTNNNRNGLTSDFCSTCCCAKGRCGL